MFPKISGKPIQLTCSEPALPEFPDLLFGSSIDNDISFFDATVYLQNKGLSVTVTDFFQKYEAPIEALMSAYGMEAERICAIGFMNCLLTVSAYLIRILYK